jgi:hypothetical protein
VFLTSLLEVCAACMLLGWCWLLVAVVVVDTKTWAHFAALRSIGWVLKRGLIGLTTC